MKFASKIAEEFAEDNELSLEDFENYNIDKIYKHHVIEKIKEKNIARKISVKNKICECCNKTWPSKQNLEAHYKTTNSQLYFAKKEIKDKDVLLTRLSNQISILKVRIDAYEKKLLLYQDMIKSTSGEPELEYNSDYSTE